MDSIQTPSDYYHTVYRGRTVLVQGNPNLLTQDIHDQIRELTKEGIRFVLVSEPLEHDDGGEARIGRTLQDIAEGIGKGVAEVMLLSRDPGIMHHGRRVPVIFSRDMANDGTHATIPIPAHLRGMMQQVREMLPSAGKIVLTSDVRREIESVFGSGTMFADSPQLKRSKLTTDEEPIFDAVNERNVSKGKFRRRSEEEIRTLKDHHTLVKIRDSSLGGYSLVPKRGGWAELSALWAGYLGNGMGDVLSEHFREEFQNSDRTGLYALSTPDLDDPHDTDRIIRRFTRYGLTHRGRVHELQTENAAALPPDVLSYDADESGRNPLLFLLQKS